MRIEPKKVVRFDDGSNWGADVAGFAIYVCKSEALGRADRSHQWGYRFESCCDRQKGPAHRMYAEDRHREPSETTEKVKRVARIYIKTREDMI